MVPQTNFLIVQTWIIIIIIASPGPASMMGELSFDNNLSCHFSICQDRAIPNK